MTWQQIINHPEYEINTEYPYEIRKCSNQRIVSESDNGAGYPAVKLNGDKYLKHRIIAEQFIPNPEKLPEIDHENKNRADYHIENLRWISRSDNLKNKLSHKGIIYEWIEDDDLPDDLVEVNDYGKHEFEDYFYSPSMDRFMFWNGIKTRLLHINYDKRNGSACVRMMNTNNKCVSVYYSKFKRIYGFN